jgi:uncharacterized phiE125 gp8 family phage protein
MGLTIHTAPASEPLTLAQAKAQCEVDSDYWDELITALIPTARVQVENITGLQLMPATWTLTLDAFPCFSTTAIRLPKNPITGIDSITYVNDAGDATVWSPSDYTLDATGQPARLLPAYDKTWPTARRQPNAVTIQFDAGYANAAAIPAPLISAMKLLISHLFKNREATEARALVEIPLGVQSLIAPYAVYGADWGVY